MASGQTVNLIILFVLLATIGFLLIPKNDRPAILRKKCRALVLEGGGDKGAWEAGVVKGIIDNMPPEEVQYDVIAGVSIGSVNGFVVASYPKGSEKELSTNLTERWSKLTSSDLYAEWDDSYFGMLQGLKSRSGFLDNKPFRQYIEKMVDEKELQREFTIGVTDATEIKAETYDGKTLSKEQLKKIILASTSLPAVFPYVEYEGKVLLDGGVLINADFKGAINKCKEIASTEEDIIIDAVLPSGAKFESSLKVGANYTAWEMYFKYKNLVDFREKINDYMQSKSNYPDVQFRHIISPLIPLPSKTVPIWFTTESLKEMIQMGEKDAYEWIKNPNVTKTDYPSFLK